MKITSGNIETYYANQGITKALPQIVKKAKELVREFKNIERSAKKAHGQEYVEKFLLKTSQQFIAHKRLDINAVSMLRYNKCVGDCICVSFLRLNGLLFAQPVK